MITRTSTILLEGLKDTASDSWQEFDARYRQLLIAVGRRLGLQASDADDAAQETVATFIVQYRQGQYDRHKGRLRDWLAGIMSHKVRDIQRRQHSQKNLANQLSIQSLEQVPAPAVQAAMEQEHASAVLRQCLEVVRREVTPQTFHSFDLFVLQQWSADQVAQKLAVSTDVVYQNKRRILQRIRQLLPQLEESW